MSYKVILSKIAYKDLKNLKSANLLDKAKYLLEIIAENPFITPPSFEKLLGEPTGVYSRRINRKHRLVYSAYESNKTVHIARMWTHYE